MINSKNTKIAVIGLGYVGLPLSVEFGKVFDTFGFDIDNIRVKELLSGIDKTKELDQEELKLAKKLKFTTKTDDIKDCNIYIVTVPTPVNKFNKPDLGSLLKASKTVGSLLSKNDIVIYESTVYPGATEEECVPILEESSNLEFNKDFYCGYSPERINPGDKKNTLKNIVKVTSGSTIEIGKLVDSLYASIIPAGTHLAPSIKVAEAAKVIENSQRDINIAFVNELSIIFNKLDLDTNAVLDAASTKWNFLPFKPGLVGGHCIGIDPYYLTYKAEQVGYKPEVILAGRKINDYMGIYVAGQVIKLMVSKGHNIEDSKVLVLGITFKENCPDIRNSKVIDLIRELKSFSCAVDVADYWADKDEVRNTYNVDLITNLNYQDYHAIVLAVAHDNYRKIKLNIDNQVVFDVKSILEFSSARL